MMKLEIILLQLDALQLGDIFRSVGGEKDEYAQPSQDSAGKEDIFRDDSP